MKENTKNTLIIYLKAALKYKIALFFILGSIILVSILDVAIPWYFKKFFDVLTQSSDREAIANELLKILAIITVLEMVIWALRRVTTFSNSYFQPKVIADLNNFSFAYLHKHSIAFFNNNFVGSLVKKIKWFSRAFESITDKIFWDLLPLMISIGLIVIVLWQRSVFLGAGVFVWTIIFLMINWIFTRYKLKYDIEKAIQETEITGILADTITNNANVKLFNGYDREVKSFKSATEKLRKITKFSWYLSDYFEALQGFSMFFLEIGAIYLAIRLWQKNVLTVGDFVLLQTYLFFIFHRIWDFGRTIRQIYEALADAEEMTIILKQPHEVQDVLRAKELVAKEGVIEFKNVVFCYQKTRKVLNNFNLKIKSRERVALVGPSGAGKSTIAGLILRMHDVTSGEILIDGQNIAKVTQESLRENIGMVPQDPILFHRTIMENIRYGRPEAAEEQVFEASKLAHCHEFIEELPEGYNTYVGERGIKLSGGERQRVAIARAILRDAPILILDEATSSLDSASERLIQEALSNLMLNKTVIVVAHRLSTIKQMDRIILIEDGKIVEWGSHEALTGKVRGHYRKLWEIQSGLD